MTIAKTITVFANMLIPSSLRQPEFSKF